LIDTPKRTAKLNIGRIRKRILNPDPAQEKICVNCGVALTNKQNVAARFNAKRIGRINVFCSRKCYAEHNRGANHHQWKGGITTAEDGYILVNVKGKRIEQHRLVVMETLGLTRLDKRIHIHHINQNKKDNRPGNLLLCAASYHTALEHRMAQLYAEEHFGRETIEQFA